MAKPSPKSRLTATPPTFAVKGPHNSLFLVMTGLGPNPASGRLLRGLTPYLDEHGASHVFLFTERKRREPWSDDPESIVEYQELVHWERQGNGGVYRGICAKGKPLKREEVIQAFEYEPLSLIDWAARRTEAAIVASAEPLRLGMSHVPKPWGEEGWYTGIEKRGTSLVRSTSGNTELPYAINMFPVPITGEKEQAPILLKTLEPLPDPIYGDLYLEVHREKWEIYVVLEVNREAWPDGVGYLRAGLDPRLIESYHVKHGTRWEQALSADLEARIADYERVRRAIDALLDDALRNRNENPDLPVAPELHRELLSDVPQDLLKEEQALREEVETFLGRVPLREGDVVTLPPGILHSLQHGIKVIEFQTPTYERLIAMFGQKVITQSHWDTKEAVARMKKAPYEPSQPEPLPGPDGVKVERIVAFPQFQVNRVSVELNRMHPQQTDGNNQYQLLFVTNGKGELLLPGGGVFALEQGAAYLLPAEMGKYVVNAIAAQGVTYLQAIPTLEVAQEPEPEEGVDERLSKVW